MHKQMMIAFIKKLRHRFLSLLVFFFCFRRSVRINCFLRAFRIDFWLHRRLAPFTPFFFLSFCYSPPLHGVEINNANSTRSAFHLSSLIDVCVSPFCLFFVLLFSICMLQSHYMWLVCVVFE